MPRIPLWSLALLLASLSARGGDWVRAPLPRDHPLVGTWRLDLPELQCHELYVFRADGTATVTSGAEIGESEFSIASAPDGEGFFRWRDRVTKDNGLPDCLGNVTPVGDENLSWIHLLPTGQRFVMCLEHSLRQCIGPFVRQQVI